MTINIETQENVIEFLQNNINQKGLVKKAQKKFGISYSSVYRIARKNDIDIIQNKKQKEDIQQEERKQLSSQEKVLYNMLKAITKVRKTRNGEIRVKTNKGKFVPVTKLIKLA